MLKILRLFLITIVSINDKVQKLQSNRLQRTLYQQLQVSDCVPEFGSSKYKVHWWGEVIGRTAGVISVHKGRSQWPLAKA